MPADAVLLPKVFPDGLVALGYLTTNPVLPNLQPFKPPQKVLDELEKLGISRPKPVGNGTGYWAVAKRGWFSLQLVRLLGIRTNVSAGTLLVVEGGEITHQTFENIEAAYTTVFAAEETQTWINKVSKTMEKVYLVTAIDHISGARVARGMVKSGGADAFIEVPLDQLGQKSLELKGRFSWDDFGLHDTNDVTGIFAVQYYEVKIRSGKPDTNATHELVPTVTWVRPTTIVMGRGREEDTHMVVSLQGKLGLETLRGMAEITMREEEDEEENEDE